MNFVETKLKGCFIIEPQLFEDERGYFFESFNEQKFASAVGSAVNFVQDNQSFSTKGVIRAIHYQIGEHSQAKLVRVLQGRVLDVAVDLRRESPTFGEHISLEISDENKRQLYIPRGFGHGFSVLSETAQFFYKCDNFYNKDAEGGIVYKDPFLKIDWKIPDEEIRVSDKDLALPNFEKAKL